MIIEHQVQCIFVYNIIYELSNKPKIMFSKNKLIRTDSLIDPSELHHLVNILIFKHLKKIKVNVVHASVRICFHHQFNYLFAKNKQFNSKKISNSVVRNKSSEVKTCLRHFTKYK